MSRLIYQTRGSVYNQYLIVNIIIIPHVNSPYKTSIDERLIFYNITRYYSDGECCHVFAIAAGDIIEYQSLVYGSFVWGIHVRYNNIKYQGGHMMCKAGARTVRSRQETFNSNGGHDT